MTALHRLRPSRLDRYIVRELLPPTGLGLVAFTFMFLLQQITQLAGILISRNADLATVGRLFANALPSILSLTIPMAFLLGVLLAFGRLAGESEIVAMRAGGVSPVQLVRPVLLVGLAAGALTLYVIAVALPDANQSYRQLRYSLVMTRIKAGVKPRVFVDDVVRGLTIHASDVAADTGEWAGVFLFDKRDPAKPRLTLARRGRLVINEAGRTVDIHLEQGVVHAYDPARPDAYERQEFGSADIPLPFEEVFQQNLSLPKGDREMTLSELNDCSARFEAGGDPLEGARCRVEWHKRLAIPTACVVFGLLGLGLSLGSRREARSAAFGLSLAVFFLYYLGLRMGEQAGDTGALPPSIGMWSANAVLLALACFLLYRNHREAAFDPLDPKHYLGWLPHLERRRALPSPAPPSQEARPAIPTFAGILDRYIARQFIGYLLLVLLAFWGTSVLGHLIDIIDDIRQHHVSTSVVLHYYLFYTPFVVHLTTPFAVLVTTLTTIGVLARRNEITAMKAGGISVYRATAPAVVLGGLLGAGLFVLGEHVLPHTNRIRDQDWDVIKGRSRASRELQPRWVRAGEGRFYNYEYLEERTSTAARPEVSLHQLSVLDVDPHTWNLNQRLFASRARWDGALYTLEQGWRRSFGPDASFSAFGELRTRDVEPPGYFKREQPDPDRLAFVDLRRHVAELRELGLDVARLEVQLHQKLAGPAVSVVMTLIAIPFAFVVGHRGALYGVGVSVAIAIVYWAALGIFAALGANAMLPAFLAAWAPNVLFAAAGGYLMLTLET